MNPVRTMKSGVTLIELAICVLIIGILASLIISAVHSSRESARVHACKNNLKQIAYAATAHEISKKHFPAGRNAVQARQHSWGTALLPFLEQDELFCSYDFSLRWNAGKNLAVAQTEVPVYRCPSTDQVCPGQSDYAGNYGSRLTGLKPGFKLNQAWSSGLLVAINLPGINQRPIAADKVRDGLSHTFLIVECAGLPLDRGGGWANGHHCVAHDSGSINQHRSLRIFADHSGGANVAFGDASIQFLSQETDLHVLGALSTRAHGDRTDAK